MTATKKAPIGALTPVAIDKIRPNPFQPRTSFDPAEIKQLAASLESSGLLQPITVRAVDDGYELLAGERRTRAAESLGWTTIPAIVRTFSDEEMAVLGLVENLQRADLSPLDEAEGLKRLADELGWSQAKIAEETGIPRSTVGDRLRALELPDAWLALLRKGDIQFSHAPALHKFSELPDAAHERVIAEATDDWEWTEAKSAGRPISVEEFAHVIEREYRAELHPLSDLAPGYNGPVIMFKSYSDDRPRKYAADRDKWERLRDAKRAAEAKKTREANQKARATQPARKQVDYEAERKRNEEKAAAATVTRRAQIATAIALAPAVWDERLWRFAATWFVTGNDSYHTVKQLCAQLGLTTSNDYNKMSAAVRSHVDALPADELPRFILRALVLEDADVSPYDLKRKPKTLIALAELLGTTLDAPEPKDAAPTTEPKKVGARARRRAKAAAAADVEVTVRVTDDGVQAIKAAAEHDETGAAGSGDDEVDDETVWSTAGDEDDFEEIEL